LFNSPGLFLTPHIEVLLLVSDTFFQYPVRRIFLDRYFKALRMFEILAAQLKDQANLTEDELEQVQACPIIKKLRKNTTSLSSRSFNLERLSFFLAFLLEIFNLTHQNVTELPLCYCYLSVQSY
jgi:hypothetical protein